MHHGQRTSALFVAVHVINTQHKTLFLHQLYTKCAQFCFCLKVFSLGVSCSFLKRVKMVLEREKRVMDPLRILQVTSFENKIIVAHENKSVSGGQGAQQHQQGAEETS